MNNECNTQELGACSHAEGSNTIASGFASHAEGFETLASNDAAHAGGIQTTASGPISYAEGQDTTASAISTHAEGFNTVASGETSHAEGRNTQAIGSVSHAEGEGTTANGSFSHAEGLNTTATGDASHAEGQTTSANGQFSHAEGSTTNASGESSHSEGFATAAFGFGSHSEGLVTNASGAGSHAEGQNTLTNGTASHAEGFATVTNGAFSHAEGEMTTDNGKTGVHVMGQNGGPAVGDPDFSWYLVNGALGGVVAKILNNGSACFEGTVSAAAFVPGPVACDYAEMFEISGSEWIDVGYFVTFDGASNLIRKANANDDYILGVTSSNPGFLADTHDPACSKFLLDEWNQPIYEDVSIPAVKDREGKVILAERKELVRKLNPLWNPDKGCVSRVDSLEWAAVGLLGKLLIRDDGSCQIGGYCMPNDEGVATKASTGYRVMARTGVNQIQILFR